MSIASYSVVGRILTEVLETPTPVELGARERREGPGELFELRRSRCRHAPPFATPFHFWAHALRDLLESCGRPDLFEAMATHALCSVEPEDAARGALCELSARVQHAASFRAAAPLEVSYRMIDQEVMASWVVDATDELVAFFWLRPDWLEAAEPFDPEDENETEEEAEAQERARKGTEAEA